MIILQKALTTVPTLVTINYSEKAGKIIITANANLERWDAIFMQIVKDRRCLFKYENKI
jgi:hypothetical protein